MNKNEALDIVRRDIGSKADVFAACASMLDYICENSYHNLRYITFSEIKRVIDSDELSFVLNVITYLSGGDLELIDIKFEFIDDGYVEEISKQVVSESRITGEFYHPETGCLVNNFESKIFMYFSLSNKGGKLKCN
ncbi:hypothetical protein [Serratia ficaria]|uniref:hypothetical protein n=1 Tax=Serratia ficaria TaxID=61651 RepID=UPI00217928F3|nr:hypothetical protein [Serratia ficaria]CAI1806311.1 Uncharacterised protein [Serratia ficaria]